MVFLRSRRSFEEEKTLKKKKIAGKYPDLKDLKDALKDLKDALKDALKDLKDAYTTKINHALVNLFVFRDREFVTQVLAEVKKTLNDVEKVLKRNHEGDFSSPCLRSISLL